MTNECKENSINRQTDRIAWIDIAKGYGILFVIFAHLDVGILGTWIYTFHMPLFFLLSGYVFGLKYDFRTFVNKKIHSIVIPYITLGIPMIIFKILSYYHASTLDISTIKELIVDFCLQRRFWTLWYIACLFWLNIIFYIIVSKLKKIKCIVCRFHIRAELCKIIFDLCRLESVGISSFIQHEFSEITRCTSPCKRTVRSSRPFCKR